MPPIPIAVNPVHPASSPIALQQVSSRTRSRTVLIASSDASLRDRLRQSLSGLRWQVLEAPGGAEAWVASQAAPLEALLIDPWLPDLDVAEFLQDFHRDHPNVDLMMTDGVSAENSPRSPYHQELLYALRRSQDGDTVAWQAAPMLEEIPSDVASLPQLPQLTGGGVAGEWQRGRRYADARPAALPAGLPAGYSDSGPAAFGAIQGSGHGSNSGPGQGPVRRDGQGVQVSERIPTLIGSSAVMMEVSRRVRLVAGRTTPVLIEGPTGSGKELVAEAIHRLSPRSRKPFVAINCAAIPEALLEAELFGHTRGAFTGAVQGRTGRIESADGGTLFLDEIGEMPLGLQSKLLRFFESGELQRIGDNETVKVDVRIVAATHQPLAEDAQKGAFRADLYYRLAVFLIRTPALAEHMEDLPQLVAHFMDKMGRKSPVKRLENSAMAKLTGHYWPGNVRELEHVLERASILAGEEPGITAQEVDFGLSMLN